MSLFDSKITQNVAEAALKIMQDSVKKPEKTETEEVITEGKKSYSAKEARAGKDIGKPGKQFEKIAQEAGERYGSEKRGKKVAGAILAKLRKEEYKKDEDDEEEDEDKEEDMEEKDEEDMKKNKKKDKKKNKMCSESFSSLISIYQNKGLKKLMEEVDNDTFKKEVEEQQKNSEGKGKKKKIAAASVQAVQIQKEETLKEKELTPEESAKKEEIIKSMKKRFGELKKRYGERAKEVMYATATKKAKEVA